MMLYLIFQLISFSYCLNIDDFGAIPNDASYNVSIQNGKAFYSACLAANNGTDRTVVISRGKVYNMLPAADLKYLVNVTIQLDGTLNSYIDDTNMWPQSSANGALNFIQISECRGLVIRGTGTINGFGYMWWWQVILNGVDNRPHIMVIYNANDTLIDGPTFIDSPQYHLLLVNHLNLTVRNVNIFVNITGDNITIPTFPLNTDGIDISGKDIHLTNLRIENFDDAVAVKPLQARPSNYVNCTENVLIENSYVKFGVGMSIGSVPPNDDHNCVRNVLIRNITFEQPLKAIYIKPNPGDHGTGLISNITYENIEIYDALWWAIFIGTQQQHQPHSTGTDCSFFFPLPGTECFADPLVTVENITLRNVNIFRGVLSPGILICNETNPCTNFVFDNVNVYNASLFPISGYYCQNVSGYCKNSNICPACLVNNKFEDKDEDEVERTMIVEQQT